MSDPVILVARERRSRFGRVVKWSFWIFQVLMLAVTLGTCAAVLPFTGSGDPEVAAGAAMFGLATLGIAWIAWPAGTALLGILLLATRGRRRLVQLPPQPAPGGPPHAAPPPGPGVPPYAAPPPGPGVPPHAAPQPVPGVPSHAAPHPVPGVPSHAAPHPMPGGPLRAAPRAGGSVPQTAPMPSEPRQPPVSTPPS